jgi:hypothetical protein
MGFVSILKRIGEVAGQKAPEIVSAFNPALGSLMGTMLNAVLMAESKIGSGKGETKKAEALGAVQVAVPLILRVIESATNRELADDAQFASGIEKMNDGLVEIMNAFRILPKPVA